MMKAHDIRAVLSDLPELVITSSTTEEDAAAAMRMLAPPPRQARKRTPEQKIQRYTGGSDNGS